MNANGPGRSHVVRYGLSRRISLSTPIGLPSTSTGGSSEGSSGRDRHSYRDGTPDRSDGRRGSSGSGPVPFSRGRLAPTWIPTDDGVGGYPDRQVIVIGDTIVGRTLTLLLRRAGYDPLLVADTGSTVESRLTLLWPAALGVLEAVGVNVKRGDWSTTVEGVCVRRGDAQGANQGVPSDGTLSETSSLVVETQALRDALGGRCSERVRTEDRRVGTLTRADDGLTVRLEDGIEEWFDLAVDASGGTRALVPDRDDPREYHSLTQYEVVGSGGSHAIDRIREDWHSDALIQRIPRPTESGDVIRVTIPNAEFPATLDGEGNEGEPTVRAAVAGGDPTRIRQTKLPVPDGARTWWGTDRVAFCGPAAYPVVPATGCRVAFGIEDALAFVTELTRETSSPSVVVERYGARRAERFATRCRRAAADRTNRAASAADMGKGPLGTLEVLRTIALASSPGTPSDPEGGDGDR